ncbi:NAD(P)H-binding protein [Streptomyces platensis]|uniref:NmrA family NAD(P)-binding protein n=1 Tax=Streptomyces platensis TaxID=58346 RepID=UPI00368E9B1F
MIVITTPTGQIGRQVVMNLLRRGAPLRLIARDPSRLARQVAERVEVVQGSTDDHDVVNEACADADRVFWVVPPNPAAGSVEKHFRDFTRPLCDAIASRGVKRVVAVSSLGRGVARNAGQVSASLAMDEAIDSTGVHYRALCAPGFMDNALWQAELIRTQRVFRAPVSGGLKLPTCATRDIAAVAADLLADDSWSGQARVPLLGPEDLSHDEMAHIMSEVLGRPIRFQQLPLETYKATLVRSGMSEAWAQGLADMFRGIQQGIHNAELRTSASATPTGFRQWCEEVLRPAIPPGAGSGR